MYIVTENNLLKFLDGLNLFDSDIPHVYIEGTSGLFSLSQVNKFEIDYDPNDKQTPYIFIMFSNNNDIIIKVADLNHILKHALGLKHILEKTFKKTFICVDFKLDDNPTDNKDNILPLHIFSSLETNHVIDVAFSVNVFRDAKDIILTYGENNHFNLVSPNINPVAALDSYLEALENYTVMIRLPNPIYSVLVNDDNTIINNVFKNMFGTLPPEQIHNTKHFFINVAALRSITTYSVQNHNGYPYGLKLMFNTGFMYKQLYFKTVSERENYFYDVLKSIPSQMLSSGELIHIEGDLHEHHLFNTKAIMDFCKLKNDFIVVIQKEEFRIHISDPDKINEIYDKFKANLKPLLK